MKIKKLEDIIAREKTQRLMIALYKNFIDFINIMDIKTLNFYEI